MKKDIRQQKILDYLSHFERISISEICEIFDIVPMTARRDLKELENDHKLIRTHGGATLPSLSIHDTTLPFHQRMTQNIELKELLQELLFLTFRIDIIFSLPLEQQSICLLQCSKILAP